MTKLRRLSIRLRRDHALEATRVAIGRSKLVYVLVADKTLWYAEGRSRVAYIGTTQNGAGRVAASVAFRASDILSIRGVRRFHARVITCQPRRNVRTWTKLERALLLGFKNLYGEVPWCNTQGKRMKERNEFEYFSYRRVIGILQELR